MHAVLRPSRHIVTDDLICRYSSSHLLTLPQLKKELMVSTQRKHSCNVKCRRPQYTS